MDIEFELLRYFVIMVVGIVLIRWYERKKGWEFQFRNSLFCILWWKTVMLFILIGLNFLLDFFSLDLFYAFFFLYPILLVVVSFLVNIFLGVNIFKFVYNQKTQESLVIILIIVLIEMILETILLYSIVIPLTVISNFNL